MAVRAKTKKLIVNLDIDSKTIAKKATALLKNETEEQKLLNEANVVYQSLQNKNFDKEEVLAVLDIVKVLNELYGF